MIMSQKINIDSLLENLTSKTQNGSCHWEEISSSCYRLLLKSGSMKFSAIYIFEYDCYDFKLELYDMKECFYTIHGCELQEKKDNYNEALDSLYKAIVEWKNSELNSKITSLEKEILDM